MSKHIGFRSPAQCDSQVQPRILVTGATGHIGSSVVKSLLNEGCKPRLMVRDPAKAQAAFDQELEFVIGDFSNAQSVHSAFEGAETVLLITSGPSIAEHDRTAARAARLAGVKHLVKLSSYDAEYQVGTGAWHAQGEVAIQDSGLPFTFVRPSGFMSNALWWADSVKRYGVVRSCTGTGRIAFIHPVDIAKVTATVLLTPEHYLGAVLPITGPEALSYAEMAERIGREIGKSVGFEEISETEARDQQMSWRAGPALTEARLSIFRAIREGRLQGVTDMVETILSREALDFDAWVKENAVTFC